jgi:hypothetical protein
MIIVVLDGISVQLYTSDKVTTKLQVVQEKTKILRIVMGKGHEGPNQRQEEAHRKH